VVFAGRDYFRKGLPVLLAAWRHVNAFRPDATLVIAGREYWHGMLYARLASINRSVRLLGDLSRETLLEEIKRARALVLPSRTEAFGIVLIEAMALKTPAIATRVGGIPEALDEGRVGILVEKGDKRELACAILRCLEPVPDMDLIDMTRKAFGRVAGYSTDNLIKAVLKIYEAVSRKV
jgi:glycosyltransferase involved in cell wall biosynthesis